MKYAFQRRMAAEIDNLTDILHNNQVSTDYRNQRLQYIEDMFSNAPTIKQKIN